MPRVWREKSIRVYKREEREGNEFRCTLEYQRQPASFSYGTRAHVCFMAAANVARDVSGRESARARDYYRLRADFFSRCKCQLHGLLALFESKITRAQFHLHKLVCERAVVVRDFRDFRL